MQEAPNLLTSVTSPKTGGGFQNLLPRTSSLHGELERLRKRQKGEERMLEKGELVKGVELG